MRKFLVSILTAFMLTSAIAAPLASASEIEDFKPSHTVTQTQKDGIIDVTDKITNFDSNIETIIPENDYAEYAATSSGEKNVIVELKGASVTEKYNSVSSVSAYDSVADFAASYEGAKLNAALKSEQSGFLAELKKSNINYTLNYNYTGIVNGVALTLSASDLAAVSKMDCVKNIIYSETYYEPDATAVTNQVNAYSTGIYNTDGVSYTGSNMVVAILDTGLDYTHNAFQTIPRIQKMRKANVSAALESGMLTASSLKSNLTVDDLYKNGKVPYQFDYCDKDADAIPVTSSHGTHVAGIIAGYEEVVDYEPTASDSNMYFNEVDGHKTFKGVAVDAQLAIFKVFSDLGETGAPTEAIVAALNDAVLLDVDLINMSLGSNAGYSRSTDDDAVNEIYNRIRSSGISLIVAAGNSYSSSFNGTYGNTNLATNPDSGTMGSPATYNGALSVASISGQLSNYFLVNGKVAAYFNNARNSSSKDIDFLGLLLNGANKKIYSYVVVGGYGEDHNYTSAIRQKLSAGNCIAVVKRGSISFEDKQKIAANYGAVGCIIYNNVSGVINASLGTGFKIPTCTITMDIASQFINQTEGTIEISTSYKAGPFMSEFSSWGATPDLQLYPDVTAHGGDITSAVLGGYGVYSGTSMATPNTVGISTLIRQAIEEKYPNLKKVEVNEMLYRMLMSTATIALNNDGDPYSPRKQGAGLADILKTLNTDAYLYVQGSNKSKIELGDDPARTGVYSLRFNIKNLSDKVKTYTLGSYVMTEKMSVDGITVAERAYMLNDASVKVIDCGAGVTYSGGKFTVAAGADARITVKITLTAADKAYLDAHFKNGMYVEGYLRFFDVSADNKVDLNIPFMAFYGSWLDAPMFDLSAYDVSHSKYDDSIPEEDKLKADVYESILIGKYVKSREMYMPLGQYVYKTGTDDSGIESTIDKIAVGNSEYGIYELYGVYAGLLRGAKSLKITVTDTVTGEVVFERTNYEVRKSCQGSPGPVYLEISPAELNLKNNVKYDVTLSGAIDYENGDRVTRNNWSFSFYTDYESPYVADYDVRVVYDNKNNKTVYLDLSLYDNHYVQAVQLFTVLDGGSTVDYLTEYPIPVNSSLGGTALVTIDITQFIDAFQVGTGDYANKMGVYISDYAMNSAGYVLPIKWAELSGISITDKDGNELNGVGNDIYTDGVVNVALNSPFNYNISVLPEKSDFQAVNYSFGNSGVVEIKDGVIFGKRVGSTVVTVTAKNAKEDLKPYKFTVVVTDEGPQGPYPVRTVSFASYKTTNGSPINIINNYMTVDCGLKTQLTLNYNPWYATNKDEITWRSLTPRILSVTDKGVMTALNQGIGRVSVSYKYNGVTFDTALTVNVKEKYMLTSGYLYSYYGADELLEIPANLGAIYLSHYNKSTAGPFNADANIKVVVVPSGVTNIGTATFAQCSKLETVYLPSTLESIGYQAFQGCKKLKNIYWYKEAYFNADLNKYTFEVNGQTVNCFDIDQNGNIIYNGGFEGLSENCTAKNLTIGQRAFSGCNNLEFIDLSKTSSIYDYGFEGCSKLTEIDLSKMTSSGTRVFSTCSGLTDVITSEITVLGSSMFINCNKLESVELNCANIPSMAFYNCKGLRTVTINNALASIAYRAFSGCATLERVNMPSGGVTEIGEYAFDGCAKLANINFIGVKALGGYAFNGCTSLSSVTIGSRTSLDVIGNMPFAGCTSLSTFNVSENSRYFKAEKYVQNRIEYTVVYNADRSKVVFCPIGFKLSYNFIGESGNVIEVIGSGAYSGCEIAVDELTIPEGVKRIEDYAFYRNTFKTLILPESLEYVGVSAFSYCENLERVIFLGTKLKELSNFAFYSDISLEEVVLPDGLEKTGISVFRSATSLRSIVIPASVKELGNYTFANCSQLTSVKFAEGSQIESINKYCFYQGVMDSIELPYGLQTIGEAAFAYCYNITEITIPGSVRNWDAYSFIYNRGLKTVTIEEGVPYIGAFAFSYVQPNSTSIYYNQVLETVNLPESVKAIYPYAFVACNKLLNISLDNVEMIYDGAFQGCSFTELSSDSVQYVGGNAFRTLPNLVSVSFPNLLIANNYAFADNEALITVDFENAEMLSNYVFYNDKNLETVNMPNIKTLYSMVFYNCAKLTEFEMPNIEIMGEGVFFGAGITSITIPKTLKTMGPGCFMGCLNLKEIKVDEDNEAYFSDGVAVYKRNSDGKTFEVIAYPDGRTVSSYSILEGTTRVADYAFAYARNLSSVELPYTIKRIGTMAFYYMGMSQTSITYIFKSIQAPVLEAFYNSQNSTPPYMYNIFTYRFGYVQTDIRYPANGKGYNNFIWSNYFKEPEYIGDAAEEVTLSVIESIDKLDAATATYAQVSEIRKIINGMTETQKKLISNYYKFLEIEKLVDEPLKPDPEPNGEKGCNSSLGGGVAVWAILVAVGAYLIVKCLRKGGRA